MKLPHELSEQVHESHEAWMDHFLPPPQRLFSTGPHSLFPRRPGPELVQPTTSGMSRRRHPYQLSDALSHEQHLNVHRRASPDAYRSRFPTPKIPAYRTLLPLEASAFQWPDKVQGRLVDFYAVKEEDKFCRCSITVLSGFSFRELQCTIAAVLSKSSVDSIIFNQRQGQMIFMPHRTGFVPIQWQSDCRLQSARRIFSLSARHNLSSPFSSESNKCSHEAVSKREGSSQPIITTAWRTPRKSPQRVRIKQIKKWKPHPNRHQMPRGGREYAQMQEHLSFTPPPNAFVSKKDLLSASV